MRRSSRRIVSSMFIAESFRVSDQESGMSLGQPRHAQPHRRQLAFYLESHGAFDPPGYSSPPASHPLAARDADWRPATGSEASAIVMGQLLYSRLWLRLQ